MTEQRGTDHESSFEKFGENAQMFAWPIEEQIAYNQRFIKTFREQGGVIDEYYDAEKSVGGRYGGEIPLLLLHHAGAKTGKERVTPLSYYDDAGSPVVVGSDNGSDKNPNWVHNLRAHPHVKVELGETMVPAVAQELEGREHASVFAEAVKVLTFQTGNQAKTSRKLPVFRLVLQP